MTLRRLSVHLSVCLFASLATLACHGGPRSPIGRAPSASAPPVAARSAPPRVTAAPRAVASTGGVVSYGHSGGAAFSQVNVPFDEMVAQARQRGEPSILFFCASWCGWCSKMKRETLTDARVQARLQAFPTALYDPDTPAGRAVADRYDIHAYPTMVVVDGSGHELDRIAGASEPDRFLDRLSRF
jgi:thiol:disulfide interchange protein